MKKERPSIIDIKVIKWYDGTKQSFFYGIDVYLVKKGEDMGWCHTLDENGPLFFEKKSGARQKMKEIMSENNFM